MKHLIVFVVGIVGLTVGLALPTTPISQAAPAGKPIYVTQYVIYSNFMYVYPKATNWLTVTNMMYGPLSSIEVTNLYISKVVTN